MRRAAILLLLLPTVLFAQPTPGNRLAYLDEVDPYYPHAKFPKLTTPMWVGEKGVDAVVILAIDDMRDIKRYEAFLRPIVRRLQEIDGRGPVSIMTNQVYNPKAPWLQAWLREGVSIECHTFDHPCPFFRNGFTKAKEGYDRCVDLLNAIPNNKPVAFRMPCCDSLNTPSPRFYAEIFDKVTGFVPDYTRIRRSFPIERGGHYLSIDSSVFNVFTSNDPELPRELVQDADGNERFLPYLPPDRSFVNTIENYPYPYVIGRLCWQFPCLTPSDWQAQHRHKSNNPKTVEDWKRALDCTVVKQGVMAMVFHPHGWIKTDQIVELIDYAETKYGMRVKFLNFREALERLNKNLLAGRALRGFDSWGGHADSSFGSGVYLLDVNNDGYLDVVLGGEPETDKRITRIWSPQTSAWNEVPLPTKFFTHFRASKGLGKGGTSGKSPSPVRFGVVDKSDAATLYVGAKLQLPGGKGSFWQYDGKKWSETPALATIDPDWLKKSGIAEAFSRDCSVLLRDLDGDGRCELLYEHDKASAVFRWSEDDQCWKPLPFALPHVKWLDHGMHAAPARLIDVDGDGKLDLIFSNEKEYSVHLFKDLSDGWLRKGIAGKAGQPGGLPMIANNKDGWNENMGCWVHSHSLWWSNEGTPLLKDHVARMPLKALIQDVDIPALTPEQSLKALKPRPGFQAELMVAEPLVEDPIAFAFGPDGRLWVVEMGDYPLGTDGKGKHGGKVRVLESTKGDGKYDKMTVFLDGLGYPTGVLPWRNGVIITSAPDVFYAEDTKRDGKADKKVVLLSGFKEGNQQHRVNGLYYGIDGWVYGANGDSGGEIKSLKSGKSVNISGRDFRFKPDTGELQAISGQTQFGHCQDDWGNRFGGNNSNPCWHFALDDFYLKRNPFVPAPDPRVPVPTVAGQAPVFPLSKTLQRFNDFHTANRFTSACSPIIYRDDLFGPAYAGNLFVSEPVHNLVHREIVKPKGITFTSSRAGDEMQSEFLASTDNWFRPTMIQVGPDGAIWVADMYRFVIEHPQWIPKDWQAKLDLRAGHDKGRLYRVFPIGKKPRAIPRLDKMTTAELVALLEHPNGWHRDMAQTVLTWGAESSAGPLLEKLFRDSKNPVARLHALCTLDATDMLHPDYVRVALADSHPGVRKHALRLIEKQMNTWKYAPFRFLKMDDDPDPHVRMQLAYTLGQWKDHEHAGNLLAYLALRDGGDPYQLAAILSSVNKDNFAITVKSVLRESDKMPSAILLEKLVKLAAAFDDEKGTIALLASIASPPRGSGYSIAQYSALAAYLDTLDQRGVPLVKLAYGDKPLASAVTSLKPIFDSGRAVLADPKAPMEIKLTAVKLLGRGLTYHQEDRKKLLALMSPQSPEALQKAAVATIGQFRDPSAPKMLIGSWKQSSPSLRGLMLDTLLSRAEWLPPLLDALESKTILAAEVDAIRRQRLLDHKLDAVRKRAAAIFTVTTSADMQKLITSYHPALKMKGDATKGALVFKKNCAACHQLSGMGQPVGPDLATEASKPGEVLLTAMLDPNQAFEARYIGYLATTTSGKIVSGLLASETGSSITIIAADGTKHEIPRSELDDLTSTGKSAMPEGLERDISVADMADLIAFIRKSVPVQERKVFDNNKPVVVKANADGAFNLLATNAEIYGKTLVMEQEHKNLGYWQSNDDRAVWTVDVPKAGKYAVYIDWSCDDKSAGQILALDVGETQALTWKVKETGSWDTYKYVKIAEIQLTAGQVKITARAATSLTKPLLDLKGFKLVPVTK